MTIERFIVPGQHVPVSHYCHAVRAGDHIWISGSVGLKEDGSIPADTVAQFDLALGSIDAALEAAGGKRSDIVKVIVYLTDIDDRASINPARERFFGAHRPASTLIEVSKLVLPELTVEIEAEAIIQG